RRREGVHRLRRPLGILEADDRDRVAAGHDALERLRIAGITVERRPRTAPGLAVLLATGPAPDLLLLEEGLGDHAVEQGVVGDEEIDHSVGDPCVAWGSSGLFGW